MNQDDLLPSHVDDSDNTTIILRDDDDCSMITAIVFIKIKSTQIKSNQVTTALAIICLLYY